MAERCDIFISYAREESDWALAVNETAKGRYRHHNKHVFIDVKNIEAGANWPKRLESMVKSCTVFVLVIGPGWSKGEVSEKLNDENNWVRKEIAFAHKHNKAIFPVLVGGTAFPNNLPQDVHHILAPIQATVWPKVEERLFSDMDKKLKVQSEDKLKNIALDESYYSTVCRLDRHRETGEVKHQYRSGGRIFISTGSKAAGFRHFADRCTQEIAGSGSINNKFATELSWWEFSKYEYAEERRELLIKEIAASMALPHATELEARVKKVFSGNKQSKVFYLIANGWGGKSRDKLEEWINIWGDLLNEDKKASITVIVFIEVALLPKSTQFDKLTHPHHVISNGLGKVEHGDLDVWLKKHAMEILDDSQVNQVRKRSKRLFRFGLKTHYENVTNLITASS